MNSKRGGWITRRGQEGAEAAIDLVIEQQPQPGEQVQHLADTQIEDSPYQARQTFDDASVADLAQGMREAGFQGVLIVRPHDDPLKRRCGVYQLIYGHRRRVAWRFVCAERNQPCELPVVVREISDTQLLTIGAQENLQRQDLDPIEEAQLVAWHERMFFDKNQAEIGAMLGKSFDWVSMRSRIHKLPDALKARLHQRPRAIKQIIELAALYSQQPELALELADLVVDERLTVEAVRAIMRERQERVRTAPAREEKHNRRADATSVQDITKYPAHEPASVPPENSDAGCGTPAPQHSPSPNDAGAGALAPMAQSPLPSDQLKLAEVTPDARQGAALDLILLQEAAAALTSVASRVELLPAGAPTTRALDAAGQALGVMRRALMDRTIAGTRLPERRAYRLIGSDLAEMLVLLHDRHPVMARLGSIADRGEALDLVMCLLPQGSASDGPLDASIGELFIAVAGAGNGVLPLSEDVPLAWVREHLRLNQEHARTIAALIPRPGTRPRMRATLGRCPYRARVYR
jgi:ParB family chromosome partitioning protein